MKPTSTAAKPTKECSKAISSGMPVISTLRAFQIPITAPISIATAINSAVVKTPRPGFEVRAKVMVAASASVMPTTPYQLPRCAVSCFDKPDNAPMKNRAATM